MNIHDIMAGYDPEYTGAVGTIVGIIATKLLDGAVNLFKASVTTPMRLKSLEDSDANLRKEIATNWQKYEDVDRRLKAIELLKETPK